MDGDLTVTFEREVVVSRTTVSKEMFRNAHFEIMPDYLRDLLVAQMTKWIAKADGREETRESVRYPATWIDAVKERWLPGWAQRYWPVRYTERAVEVRHVHLCPHIDFPSDHWRHLQFLRPESFDPERAP